jgi:hypothetical protein
VPDMARGILLIFVGLAIVARSATLAHKLTD